MDPLETLKMAHDYLRAMGLREQAAQELATYFHWRLRGGFEPTVAHGEPRVETPGDEFASNLLVGIGKVADTLSECL